MSQSFRLFQFRLYLGDALLYVRSVVDVYVAEHVSARFESVGEVFFVFFLFHVAVLFVPLAYVFCHFRVEVSLIVYEVDAFI